MVVVTHEELVQARIKMLKQMNAYIIEMGDEEIWMDWITLGVPDEPSENDYEFIAENDDEWNDVCNLFGELTGEGGGLIPPLVRAAAKIFQKSIDKQNLSWYT